MGGHSKKHGKGGGGGGKNRNKPPEQRKKLTKDPGVPDLKKAAQNLTRTARNRNHSAYSISALRGASHLRPTVAESLKKTVERYREHTENEEEENNNNNNNINEEQSEEMRLAAERRAMTALAVQCAEKAHHFAAPQQWVDEFNNNNNNNNINDRLDEDIDHRGVDKSLRRFYKEFQKVVENSDVLLQVVDARDPLGCRLTQLERAIRSQFGDDRKKMVIVLNKVDLLPSKEVVDKWIHFFEAHEGVTCIPFTATAKGTLSHFYVTNMFRRLRAFALNAETGARKAIVVGVIGYPNVGKSSVINALKRKHVVGVGNMPGFTTGNTEVELRSDIRVMDCPGVVSPGEDNGDVVLRNAVKVSDLANPFTPVQRLLQRCTSIDIDTNNNNNNNNNDNNEYRQQLLAAGIHPLALFYNIGSFDVNDTMAFIRLVGQRRGRLRQGGAIDEEGTARMILQDWNDGRIAYYTLPPTSDLFGRSMLTTRHGAEEDGSNNNNNNNNNYTYNMNDSEDNGPQVVTSLSNELQWDGLPTFHLSWRNTGGKRGTVYNNNNNNNNNRYNYSNDNDDDDDSDVEM